MIVLLLLSIFLHQASSNYVNEPVSFFFSSFNNQSCRTGSLICTGSVTAYNGYLSLTSEPVPGNSSSPPTMPLNNIGRVLYKQPVLAWPAVIRSTFTIMFLRQGTWLDSADGLTFIFAPDNKPSPDYSNGKRLGIADADMEPGGNVSQLAVELDTYKNSFDIDGNHVGIDITSANSVAAESLDSTGIDLKSGRLIKVQIDYNGWTEMLYVSVAYPGDPLQRVLERRIILSEIVPSSVYVGFTAATGEISQSHRVIDWSFITVPLPSYSLGNQKLIKSINHNHNYSSTSL